MVFTFFFFFNQEIKSIKEELATRLNSSETSDLLKEKDEQIRGLMEEGVYLVNYEKYCNKWNACHIISCYFPIKNKWKQERFVLKPQKWQVTIYGRMGSNVNRGRDTCMQLFVSREVKNNNNNLLKNKYVCFHVKALNRFQSLSCNPRYLKVIILEFIQYLNLQLVLCSIIILFGCLVVNFSLYSCFNFSVTQHSMKRPKISQVIEIKYPSWDKLL